jgi:hypothetical protein
MATRRMIGRRFRARDAVDCSFRNVVSRRDFGIDPNTYGQKRVLIADLLIDDLAASENIIYIQRRSWI